MFLVFWRPQEWLLPWLYGWGVLDATIGLGVLSFLMEMDQGNIRLPKEPVCVYMVIGLWFSALMSHIAHTYFVGLIDTIVPVSKICFFTILLLCVLDSPFRLRKVAWLFVMMAAFMAVHALLQDRRGFGFDGLGPIYIPGNSVQPGYTRSLFFGIFEDPNDLAQMFATSIPFCFVLSRRKSLLSILFGCALTWLLVEGLLTTHSRGGMVALITVSAVMIVLILPARWLPFLLTVLGVGALVLCPLSSGYLDDSAHDRVAFWGEANRVFKTAPLFGIGYGMFAEYISGDRAAHNAFVLCYTELGVFGYWFWFGLLVLGVLGSWRTRTILRYHKATEAQWLKRFAGLSIAAMAGYSASSYFLSRAFVYPMLFLFGILGSIPSIAGLFLEKDQPSLLRPGKDMIIVTAAVLVSIIYIYASIVLLNKAWMG